MRWYALLFFILGGVFAQEKIKLSPNAQISILTCAPGKNELYSYFGHSAMRVKDDALQLDRVYNYGTFNFNTPNFYLKFCQGKLLYELSSYDYKYFPYIYYKENRWVKAQILNLTSTQKQQLFNFLEWNALPENKKYSYDFFYDNCATKMYEVIEKSIGNITFNFRDFPKGLTHRDLIHLYLPKNAWATFGIDLALGAVIDNKATYKQYLFLPDFVYKGFKNSTFQQQKLILKEAYLLPNYHLKLPKTSFWLSPICISLVMVCITIFLLFVVKKTKYWTNFITSLFGFTGIVIFALWFFTEHTATKFNLNLLWANPLLICFPLVQHRFKKIISYVGLSFLVLFVLVAFLGIQQFHPAFYLLAFCMLAVYVATLFFVKPKAIAL